MIHPVFTPRINNNDDQVRLSALMVQPVTSVRKGQEIAEVETDKASFAVAAERDGYLLKVVPAVGEMVEVGSVLAWLGDSPEEAVPEAAPAGPAAVPEQAHGRPTAKASLLLAELGLDESVVPVSGDRLTVADVEAYAACQKQAVPAAPAAMEEGPAEEGSYQALSMEERGMLRSVLWHRDVAAPAYLEISYDREAWDDYAAGYAQQKRLMGSPLIALMAHRLAGISASHARLNCTMVNGQMFRYAHVNLGLTIQADETLYLVVVREAEKLDAAGFIKRVNALHKSVLARRLGVEELTGASVGFTSMSRWAANRHIPILPRHVSLMVAHTITKHNEGVLGATYDHRLLSGGDAIQILNALATPPAETETA